MVVKEKASLISQRSISSVFKLVFLSAFKHAFVGAILKSYGGNSASAKERISASGYKLYFCTNFSDTNNKEQAPSLSFEAFPPVIEPLLLTLKTGFRFRNFFSLNF